jgi:hypothetical protein
MQAVLFFSAQWVRAVRASLYAREGIRVAEEDSSRPNHKTIKFSYKISVIYEFLQKMREMG